MNAAFLLAIFLALAAPVEPLPQSPEQAAQAPAGPAASEILDRAVAVQNAGDVADSVQDFEVWLALTVDDPERGRVTFDVHRAYLAPNRLWTRVRDAALTGSDYREGYDGAVAWHADRKGVTLYDSPDFQEDRDRVRADVETMQLLLRFFFLDNLVDRLEELRRLPDADGFGRRAYMLEARGNLGEPGTTERSGRITLWIDCENHHLLGVRIEPDDEPGRSEQFCFWHHRPNAQGIVVPGSVKLFRDDAPRPAQEIVLEVEECGDGEACNRIRFNTGIEASRFALPRE